MKKSKKTLLKLLLVPAILGITGGISAVSRSSSEVEKIGMVTPEIKKAYSDVTSSIVTNATAITDNNFTSITQDKGLIKYYMTYNYDDEYCDWSGGMYFDLKQSNSFFKVGYSYKIQMTKYGINPTISTQKITLNSVGQQYLSGYKDSVSNGTRIIEFSVSKTIPNNQILFTYLNESYYIDEYGNGPAFSTFKSVWNDFYTSMRSYFKVYQENNILINGATKEIPVDVDSGYTQEQILSQVSAKDLFGNDCTVSVGSSDYKTGQVGRFTIILNASDAYGQTATATLIINVRDYAKPTITQTNSNIRYPYGKLLTEAELLSNFTFADNMGTSGLTTSFTYPSGFDITKALVCGTYSLILKVTDPSGNYSTKTFSVSVYDEVAPVISRVDNSALDKKITISYSLITDTTATDVILPLFRATDAIDGNCEVYLKAGTIPTGAIGDFNITIGAKDTKGNESTLTVNYTINADIPPVFVLSDALVNATVEQPLSIAQLLMFVQNYSLKDVNASNISVNANGYLENSTTEGSYPVSYSYINDDTGEEELGFFTLDVVSLTNDESDQPDEPDLEEPEAKEDNFFVHAFKQVFSKDIKNSTAVDWFVVAITLVLSLGLVGFVVKKIIG